MKKYFEIISVISLIIIINLLNFYPKLTFYLIHKKELNEAVRKIQYDNTKKDTIEIKGIKEIDSYDNFIYFITDSTGIVSSSNYKGLYYSEDGPVMPKMNYENNLEKTFNGWKLEINDNHGYTKKIAKNWYYFEVYT